MICEELLDHLLKSGYRKIGVTVKIVTLPGFLFIDCSADKNDLFNSKFFLCFLNRRRISAFHGSQKPIFCLLSITLNINTPVIKMTYKFHSFSITSISRFMIQFKGFC